MAEPETEIQTLERLEAALARIAAHAGSGGSAVGDRTPGDGAERAEIAAALDRVIAQLRAALDETAPTEQG